METNTVPDTIKDWLAGKLVRALPKRLTQRLLAYFLDNRDMKGVLAFKEKNYADVPEFTILMYKSEKSKERREKEQRIKEREYGVFEEDVTSVENVFNENQIADEEGIQLCGEELIVDPTMKVPMKPLAKIAIMERKQEKLSEQLKEKIQESKYPKYDASDLYESSKNTKSDHNSQTEKSEYSSDSEEE